MSILSPRSEEEAEVRDGYLVYICCALAIFICSYASHKANQQTEQARISAMQEAQRGR